MKSTENFKRVIQKYLNDRAEFDSLFAKTMEKENKNIDDCITYILTTVQKSGCSGFDDAEIYQMAVHYYDEDNIEVGTMPKVNIVTNHHVELTEEEKKEIKDKAIEDAIAAKKKQITAKTTAKKADQEKPTTFVQTSLF